MKRSNSKSSWQRNLLIVLCVILALILSLLIFVVAYTQYHLNRIKRPDDVPATLSPSEIDAIQNATDPTKDPSDPTSPTLDPDNVEFPTGPADIIENENRVNILLIGQDRRPGEGRCRSDVMLLCSFDKSTNTLTMTSFMRDLWVQIPGYLDNRLNAPYQLEGMTLLDDTLAYNFGVQIDGNIEVDFKAFEKIINIFGGVDLELTRSEVNYMAGQGHYGLKVGMNHLNGAEALTFARARHLKGDDFARTNRQRMIVTSLVDKSRGLTLVQMNELLNEILPLLTTDMSNSEILNYLADIGPRISGCTIISQRIPTDDTYKNAIIRGNDVLVITNMDKVRKLLRDTIGSN